MQQLKIDELDLPCDSSQDFEDAFSRLMEIAPTKVERCTILHALWVDTPLGPMIAIGDDRALHLLEFVSQQNLESKIARLRQRTKSAIVPGYTAALRSIESELLHYFEGRLKEFKTRVTFIGSSFQKNVWEELKKIPFGITKSYAEIAANIGRPSAYRAVAQANGTNQLAIIIPCHRVINTGGALGGYSSGLMRKKWLLNHESSEKIQTKNQILK